MAVDEKLKEDKVIIEGYGLGDVVMELMNTVTKPLPTCAPVSVRAGVTLLIQCYK